MNVAQREEYPAASPPSPMSALQEVSLLLSFGEAADVWVVRLTAGDGSNRGEMTGQLWPTVEETSSDIRCAHMKQLFYNISDLASC